MRKSVPTIPYRRKRELKTNYRKRVGLLKSGSNRLVIRKSNKYITIQVVSYKAEGDVVVKSCSSQQLAALGWKFSAKNIPAAYLTGLLIAKNMSSEKDKVCIADFGLQVPLKGDNKLYAALKGVIDGGLSVKAGEGIFPSEDKLLGKNKSEDMQKAITDVKTKLLG